MLSSSNNMDIVHDRSSLALLGKGYKETMNILSLYPLLYMFGHIYNISKPLQSPL